MITPFDAYETHIALKTHFKDQKYDFFKYGGRIRVSAKSFEIHKDKFRYTALARKPDLVHYILANIIHGQGTWVGDLLTEEAERNYVEWQRVTQSITRIFSDQISFLDFPFNSNFLVADNQHPPLIKLYLRKHVSLETIIILDDLLNFSHHWDKRLMDDPVWSQLRIKIAKYRPFLKHDKAKITKVILSKFES